MDSNRFLLLRRASLWQLLAAVILQLMIGFGNTVSAQRQTANSFRSKFGPNYLIGYYTYLPQDYATNPTKDFPVLIFLHGMGEKAWKPTDLSQLPLVKKNGPPMLIEQGQDFPFIVISPQCPFGGWDKVTLDDFKTEVMRPGELVDEVLEKVKTIYRIDPNRVYVSGLSMGGAGTWAYAQKYPHKVAACIPVAGWPEGSLGACQLATNKVAIWAFQGIRDGGSNVQGFVNQVNACNPAPVPLAKATIYDSAGHDVWERTYNNTGKGIAPDNIYNWLMRQSKNNTNPLPTANAGADRSITLPTNSLSLTGTGTDVSPGTITTYAWTKVSGPAATLSGANTATLNLTGLVAGTYVFRLTVTDNGAASSSDDVIVTVNPTPSGNGLKAEFYANKELTGTPIVTTVPQINFEWGTVAPITGIPLDNFSVRFTGKVKPLYSQTYTFTTTSDDGIRLWVNGTLLVNNWTNHAATDNSATIALVANQLYDLKVEYYDATSAATVKLWWASTDQPKQIIPQAQLFLQTPSGTGLKADYFPTKDLTGTPISRIDATVNFDWLASSPVSGIPVDNFSARWTGKIQPAYSEAFTFYTLSDDGIRLWVNNVLVIDNWTNHGATENASAPISLVANQQYDIKLEYYDATSMATAKLSWKSTNVAKAIIPQANLYPPVALREEEYTISEESNVLETNLYPVPAKNSVVISYPSAVSEQLEIRLTDELSQEVLHTSFQISSGQNERTLDLSQVKNGVYTLTITGSGQRQVRKLIVTK